MTPPEDPNTSWAIYKALGQQFMQGGSQASLVTLILRLIMEVEALREALSSPETPEAVRESYRQAYARIAVLAHNAAGPSGGAEKLLRRFVPPNTPADRFAPELAMMARLGASEEDREALRAEMEIVETYT
jgi:hypothetical protein